MHPDRSRRGFLGVHIVPQILSSYCVALVKVETKPTTHCSCRSRGRDCVSVGDNVMIVHGQDVLCIVLGDPAWWEWAGVWI